MAKIYQGNATAAEGHFAIVVARFNESLTSRLMDGAVATLTSHGIADDAIDVVWVPGAFEIPTLAERLAASGRYVAVICLGVVIRGETTHDQHINQAVSSELAAMGVRHKMPILFGLLTCNTLEQAMARSGGPIATTGKDVADKKVGNKGIDCAEAALEMVDLIAQLPTAE